MPAPGSSYGTEADLPEASQINEQPSDNIANLF